MFSRYSGGAELNEADWLLKQINDRFTEHKRAIEALASDQERIRLAVNDHAARFNQQAAVQRSGLQELSQYNNIVMTVGYAGFFGLWSLVKELQPEWPSSFAMAALCMAISLMVFVLWEVGTMGARTVCHSSPTDFVGADHWLRRGSQSLLHWLDKAWPIQYLAAVAAGLAGYLCLVVVLIAQLLSVL